MRALVATAFLGAAVACATAETPEGPPRDAKSWAQLIEAARARGGEETKLDKSSSYVFQQQNGDYLTLTEWRAPVKRFVCVIAKNQKATVCVQWETGKTTYGERADAASPWKTHEATALEDTEPTTQAGQMFKGLGDFVFGALSMKPKPGKAYNYYYFQK